MTAPTPAQLDQAVINAMRQLAVDLQANPVDPAIVDADRQTLLDARNARGYPSA